MAGVLLLHPAATCGTDSKGGLCFPVSPPLRKKKHHQVTKEADISGKVNEYTRGRNSLNFLQGRVAGCPRTLDLTMQSWICDSHKDFSVTYIGHRVVTVPKSTNWEIVMTITFRNNVNTYLLSVGVKRRVITPFIYKETVTFAKKNCLCKFPTRLSVGNFPPPFLYFVKGCLKMKTSGIIVGILCYHQHNHHRYHYHYHRPCRRRRHQ